MLDTRKALLADLRHVAVKVVGVLLFAAGLHWVYQHKIAPQFAYSGLTYRDPAQADYWIAVGLTMLVAICLPWRIRHVSDFIWWVVFTVAAAPSILLAQYSQTLPSSEATRLGLIIGAATVGGVFVTRFRPIPTASRGIADKASVVWPALIALSLLIYGYLTLSVGIHLSYLSFSDVYDIRDDYKQAAGAALGIGYLLPIQQNVINPLFIVRGLYGRRPALVTLGAVGQLVIYTTTGQKVVFLSLFAVPGLIYLFRGGRLTGARFLYATTGVILGAISLDAITNTATWTALLTRRFLIVPGALTAGYVAVFDERPKFLFAELLGLWGNAYSEGDDPAHLVGALFVGDPGTNANVSLFGHGYASYGFTGILIETLFLAVVLWFIDAATDNLPLAPMCAMFLMLAITLTNISAFTATLTGGLAAAFFLCLTLPAEGWAPQSSDSRAKIQNKAARSIGARE